MNFTIVGTRCVPAAKGFDLYFEPSEAVVRQAAAYGHIFANTKDELVIDMSRWQRVGGPCVRPQPRCHDHDPATAI